MSDFKAERIVFAALAIGPWLMAGAMTAVRATADVPLVVLGDKLPLMTTIALFVSVVTAFGSRGVTSTLVGRAAMTRPAPDARHVLRQTQLLGQAMTEAGGLFGALAWFVEGHPAALVAPVVGTVAMLRLWPGPARQQTIEQAIEARAPAR